MKLTIHDVITNAPLIFHGKYLKEQRNKAGLTADELCYKIKFIGRKKIYDLECGNVEPTEFTDSVLRDYFLSQPFALTEDQMINAKPLLDSDTGLTVGDITPELTRSEIECMMKLIYK